MSGAEAGGTILERQEGAVVVLTLNAPQKRNALVPAIREGLIEALARLEDDAECRAIVITGAEGCFCAGGDISNAGPFTPLQVRQMMKRPQRLLKSIVGHSKPIIAAVDGPAFGAGFALAMACDFVAAAEDSTFCAAYGRIGVMPDVGLLWSLPLRVGIGTLREIVMFADVLKADEAKEKGMVDWLAPASGALSLAIEKAQKLATKATASIALTKALLARSPLSMDMVLAHEVEAQAVLSSTHDAQEGIRAFAEKRRTEFKGC